MVDRKLASILGKSLSLRQLSRTISFRGMLVQEAPHQEFLLLMKSQVQLKKYIYTSVCFTV